MNCFFYQTKTKYDNTGDALINSALLSELRNHGKVYANCSAEIPICFLEELKIREDERITCKSNTQFALKIAKYALTHREDNVYIVSGLGDIYGGGSKKVIRNILSACILPFYTIIGVKNVRIGRSFGPMSRGMEFSEWLRGLFVSSYFVRDTQSLARCKKMGIKQVQLCPDMSWIYDEGISRKNNNTDTVMINMKGSTLNISDQQYMDALVEQCKTFIKTLEKHTEKQVDVVIAYQVQEDAEFSRHIYEQLMCDFRVELIDHQIKLGELREYYSRCGYHLSNRMHSLLSGYKYGSLPVAIIDVQKHHKITSTMLDCNLEDYVIDVYDVASVPKMINIISRKEQLYQNIVLTETMQAKMIRDILQREFD